VVRWLTPNRMARCPTCRRAVRPREENPAFPFCSPRCRAVDLGKWFIGAYRVPDPDGPKPDGGSAAGDEGDGNQTEPESGSAPRRTR